MKKINKKILLLTSLVCLIPLILGLILFNRLPDLLASHWNVSGIVDAYIPKLTFIIGFPLLMVFINFLVILATTLDPKRKHNSDQLVSFSYWIIPLLSLVVSTITYFFALGFPVNVSLIVTILCGLLLAVIGNYMPKIKPNYTIGIKVPWTLNDDDIWYATHRFAGPLWVIGGLLIIIYPLFTPPKLSFVLFLLTILILTIVPIFYAYLKAKSSSNKKEK